MRLFLLTLLLCCSARAAELRGIWWYPLTNSSGLAMLTEITNKVALTVRARCNAYFADVVSSHGVAITNGSATDDFAEIVRVCKGAGIASYLWYAPYNVKTSGPEITAHSDWRAITKAGTVKTYLLCLNNPDVRSWELSFITNFVARYPDLTGVHLEEPAYDYGGATTAAFCTCAYCTNYFQTNYGVDISLTTAPVWAAQQAAFAAANNAFVGTLRTNLTAIRSSLVLTANMYGAYDQTTLGNAGGRWYTWENNGWINWATPQLYDTWANVSNNWTTAYSWVNPGSTVTAGLGGASNAGDPGLIYSEILTTRALGASGFIFFRGELLTDAMVNAIAATSGGSLRVSHLRVGRLKAILP